MKKMTAVVFCLVMVLSMVGCGGKQKINGDTTIQVDETVYYNTKEAILVEPGESAIVYVEPSLDNGSANDKITAYAFINEETLEGEILVGRIEGEWYKFLPKQVTAETE